MFLIISKKIKFLFLFPICLVLGIGISHRYYTLNNYIIPINSELNEKVNEIITEIIDTRNKAILNNNSDALGLLYNKKVRNGLWAYEHELKKMRYLHNWEKKQGIYYKNIGSTVI